MSSCADVQQARHAAARRLEHVARDDGAHQRELQQVLRRAADVGAEIEHVGRAARGRGRQR